MPKSKDEEQETSGSAGQAGEEVWKRDSATETVDRDRAFLDFRHDPGDQENHENADDTGKKCIAHADGVATRGANKSVIEDGMHSLG